MKRMLATLVLIFAVAFPALAITADIGLSLYPQWKWGEYLEDGQSLDDNAFAFALDIKAPFGNGSAGVGLEAQVGLAFPGMLGDVSSMESVLDIVVRMGPLFRFEPSRMLGLFLGLGLDVDVVIDSAYWRGSDLYSSNQITTGLYGRAGIDFTFSSLRIGLGAMGTWSFLQHNYEEVEDTILDTSTVIEDSYRELSGWAVAPFISFSFVGS